MIYNKFSEREKHNKQKRDPYLYNEIPIALRNQIFYVLSELLDATKSECSHKFVNWRDFWNACCKAQGLPPPGGDENFCISSCQEYIQEANYRDVLNIIDIAFQNFACAFSRFYSDPDSHLDWPEQRVRFRKKAHRIYTEAATDLNTFFQWASVGYQLEGYQRFRLDEQCKVLMTRVDTAFPHSEMILPALVLLHTRDFKEANDEFLKAHRDFRNGRFGECITKANGAFECVMIAICEQRNLECGSGTASELIRALCENQLIPCHMREHFERLVDTLGSGLHQVRNKDSSSHDRGTSIAKIPPYLAEYAMHLVAANILFLVRASRAQLNRNHLPKRIQSIDSV